MSELIDPRPVFTIVMGCNGVGKSAWKRLNYDSLPDRYYDQDSIAGGIGDWNSQEARERTREFVDQQIQECLDHRLDFGIESTFSGLPGPRMVQRMQQEGYRIEGIYLGTADPSINIARIEYRVFRALGHAIDPKRIPSRWKHSLSNLCKHADHFDQLQIFDNSKHDELRLPDPLEQYQLTRGKVVWQTPTPEPWAAEWLDRLEQRQASLQRRARKNARRQALKR